jgi:hypothetical protein
VTGESLRDSLGANASRSSGAHNLIALAEEELGLLAAGRVDELADLHDRRDAALAALPAQLGEADRATLAHARMLQEQVTVLLQKAVAQAAADLARLDRGQTAIRGYASTLKTA